MKKEKCDCLNFCGDDTRIKTDKVEPCNPYKEAQERKAAEAAKPPQVTVDAAALHRVLSALSGPPHKIHELQAIRNTGLVALQDNPIELLARQFNDQVGRINKELEEKGG